jgi:hypothetical protein
VNSRDKGFIPKYKGHNSMSMERKSNFDNMSMFSFRRPILLMSMWERYMMSNTNVLEKRSSSADTPHPSQFALQQFSD